MKPSLGVQVPNIWVARILVIVVIIQILGKYMTIEDLDA